MIFKCRESRRDSKDEFCVHYMRRFQKSIFIHSVLDKMIPLTRFCIYPVLRAAKTFDSHVKMKDEP